MDKKRKMVMEIDLLRKMANVWEVLERHTDTNHLLASFCRRQKNINGQIALCLAAGAVFGIITDIRFEELQRKIEELYMEIERLKYEKGD